MGFTGFLMNGPEKKLHRLRQQFNKFASLLGSVVHNRGAATPDTANEIAFHLERADALLRVGEYDNAAAYCQDAINLAPGDKALQDKLQECHVMREEFRLSVESFWKETQEDTLHQAEMRRVRPPSVAAGEAGGNHGRRISLALPAAIVVILAIVGSQLTNRSKVALPPHEDLHKEPARPPVAASNKSVAVIPDPPPGPVGKSASNARATIEVKKSKKQTMGYAHVHPADTVEFE
jgi:hypothetical protein